MANLRRVTGGERAAIRAELEAHMEDHMLALMDLGYEEELAEERMLQHMGDPAEIGRELDQQYPPHWLVLKRITIVLTVIFILLTFTDVAQILNNAGDSFWARFYPEKLMDVHHLKEVPEVVQDTDIRVQLDDVMVRVYQVALEDADAACRAYVALSCWNRNPFAEQPEIANSYFWMTPAPLWVRTSSGRNPDGGSGWLWAFRYELPVEYGDSVQLTYDAFGQTFDLTVELPWEETP
ncbi:MAG: hypothetical protein IJ396_06725 [Oscillibacter sp.]|nr:hypothetical protein [Oscillibacter sp.]